MKKMFVLSLFYQYFKASGYFKILHHIICITYESNTTFLNRNSVAIMYTSTVVKKNENIFK